LEGLEADEATLSQPGPIEDLGEEAALTGTGLASNQGGCRQPCAVRAQLKLSEPIELLPPTNERCIHRGSLSHGQARPCVRNQLAEERVTGPGCGHCLGDRLREAFRVL
jgi:hypothetical protein